MQAKGKIFSAKYPRTNPAGSAESYRQFWGELVLLDKQKSLPFLSHRSLAMTDTLLAEGFHAPPPLIIQTTSATTPFVLRATPAHVDWWTDDPFFFFPPHFLIPPYVSMAHMTSLPSHPLHPDTISHFTFFPFRGGMGSESDTHQLFYLIKT